MPLVHRALFGVARVYLKKLLSFKESGYEAGYEEFAVGFPANQKWKKYFE